MMSGDGLTEYDNLTFLRNAFEWLAQGGDVASEAVSWGEIKQLFRWTEDLHVHATVKRYWVAMTVVDVDTRWKSLFHRPEVP